MTPAINLRQDNDQVPQHIFQQKTFRKIYFKILEKYKEFYKKTSTTNFLQNCLDKKVIPKTFKIKNQPLPNSSSKHEKNWIENSQQTSFCWIESALIETRTQSKKIKYQIDILRSELFEHLNERDKILVEQTLISKNIKNLEKCEKSKLDKLNFLTKSQVKSINEFELNSENPNPSRKKRNRPGIRCRKYRQDFYKSQSKKNMNAVFNYSSLLITDDMQKLLNRGLNFCIKPLKINLSSILTDFKRFKRKMLWHEYFYGEDKVDYKAPLFKTEKTNVPRNHPQPRALEVFHHSVENFISDKSNWNRKLLNPKRSNISDGEFNALNELIDLQKNRVIVIKPADKGAGICILNFWDYVDSCHKHLSSVQPQPSGPPLPYYKPSSNTQLQKVKKDILCTLKHAKSQGWISQEEYTAMDPSDANTGRFYQIFKVHKDHPPNSIPPARPIISGNGSITENLSRFVDFHAKPLVKELPSYIKDTPDFLRKLSLVNSQGKIPDNAMLVSIDVSALYTNIPMDEGIQAMQAALNERQDQTVPTNFIIELLRMVLKFNFFQFDSDIFLQEIGTAMGTACAPTYANIKMGTIDKAIRNLALNVNNGMDPIQIYFRFIDDLFLVYTGSVESLDKFLSQINDLHPTLKFTFNFTCPFTCTFPPNTPHDCFCHTSRSLPFLDTLVSIKDGQLETDLYRKPTDRCQYLLPSSCHPSHVTKNIPYSLALRLVRICSQPSDLQKRLAELKTLLQSREYPNIVIENAISRASAVPREQALREITKNSHDRVVFATDYHPALPSYSDVLKRSWKVMIRDPYLSKVYSQPPMVAYRQPKQSSLRQILVKSKIPPLREKRNSKGFKKCNMFNCNTCPFVSNQTSVKSSATNFSLVINQPVNCESENVIYCISCNKSSCKYVQYIGETKRPLKKRFSDHCYYVKKPDLTQPIGFHFNLPGHSISNMKICIVEKCSQSSDLYRKQREEYFITKFNTKYAGLNKKI